MVYLVELLLLVLLMFNQPRNIYAAEIGGEAGFILPTLSVANDITMGETLKITDQDPYKKLPIFNKIDSGSGELSAYEQYFMLAYSSLVQCFGARLNTRECTDKSSGDINNDGVINQLDYNLLLIGFDKVNRQKLLRIVGSQSNKDASVPATPALSVIPEQAYFQGQSIQVYGVLATKIAGVGSLISVVVAAGVTLYLKFNRFKPQKLKHLK